MKKDAIKSFIVTAFLFILFGAFTYLVMKVDVQAIGPEGSKVGLANINKAVSDALGYNAFIFKISEYAGNLAFVIVGAFALLGLVMLIRRKSLAKVDPDIYALGGLYILDLIVYFGFDKVAINFRPVLLEEGLEPSYPSSHTVLALTVAISAMIEVNMRIRNQKLFMMLETILVLLMAVIIVTRVLSGVHWLTDIIGSMLLSGALVMLFQSVVKLTAKREA